MREFHIPYMEAMSFPIDVGFGLLAWHQETHPWAKFVRQGNGYVAQEITGEP